MGQRDVPDWFSFYVYEFMSDERVVAMTLEQVGAYVLLMLGQWINGSIPADIPSLARLLKRTTAEMEILWAGVGPCFTPHPTEPGRLIQTRLEEERAETLARIRRKREKMRLVRERASTLRHKSDTCERVPTPCTVLSLNTSKKEEEERFAEFRDTYPNHRLDNLGLQLFMTATDQVGILERLRLAVKSEEWTEANRKYVPKASKWITDGALAPAAPAPEPTSRYVEWDGKS